MTKPSQTKILKDVEYIKKSIENLDEELKEIKKILVQIYEKLS